MRSRKGALSVIYNIVETQVSLSQQFRRSVRVSALRYPAPSAAEAWPTDSSLPLCILADMKIPTASRSMSFAP